MKKYNTIPINFNGCHPVIAEALKRCEIIKCRVWDSDWVRDGEIEAWICRYDGNSSLPYRPASNTPWKHAEPIPLKTRRVMPPERAIPTLIAEGWEFNNFGDLICPGEVISAYTFQYFGKPCDTPAAAAAAARFWPPCVIEEVEDE